MLLAGAGVLGVSIFEWARAGFGNLSYESHLRRLVIASTLIVTGLQLTSASFFLSVLGLKTTTRKPPEP